MVSFHHDIQESIYTCHIPFGSIRCQSDHRHDTWLLQLCLNHSFAEPEPCRGQCVKVDTATLSLNWLKYTQKTEPVINSHAA